MRRHREFPCPGSPLIMMPGPRVPFVLQLAYHAMQRPDDGGVEGRRRWQRLTIKKKLGVADPALQMRIMQGAEGQMRPQGARVLVVCPS